VELTPIREAIGQPSDRALQDELLDAVHGDRSGQHSIRINDQWRICFRWQRGDAWVALGAILLGAVVPFTLVAIMPTNKQLLDPALDPHSERATALLVRWGRLHAVRSVSSGTAFLLFVLRLAEHAGIEV